MILGLLLGLLVGSALGAVVGAELAPRRDPGPTAGGPAVPVVHVLEDHPAACVCAGTGKTEDQRDCPMLWRRPQDQVRLIGRLPRGSQR